MSPQPTIEELFHEPALARELTPESAFTLLSKVTALLPILLSRACTSPAHGTQENPSAQDKESYLSSQEVCDRFNVTLRWLYRNKRRLPHSQPTRKLLIFPEQRLQRWFANRKAP
jgi:hypothetical protein